MAQRTVLVAGTGSIKRDAVYENLADWLGYKKEDDDEYQPTSRATPTEFVFLAHPELTTRTVQYVFDWTGAAEIEYVSFYSEADADHKSVGIVNKYARAKYPCADIDDMHAQASPFLSRCDGETILLVLTDPSETEGTDAGVDQLIVDVAKHGVTVLDLGCALHEYPVQAAMDRLTEENSEEECDEEPAEVEGAPQPESLDIQEDIAAAHHAQSATNEPSAPLPLEHQVARLARTLAEYISLTGPTFGADEEQSALALHDIQDTLASIEKDLAADTPDSKEELAAVPEKRAAKGSVVKRGWYDDEEKEWKPVKGRPRRNVQIADITWNDTEGKWEPAV
ncbi:hypothetical protein [Streptomyces rimosus]|uniref:hypothetical protein n=1 Tax=Streptomyces rimosus TaxID=1927 RepID=UPI0004C54022|nr:hypothetical protein [Streptomyces rimosus]